MSLTVQKVSHLMGTQPHQALNHVDLDLPTHQLTLLLGLPGAGKSTLLLLLAGLMQPTAGEIFVDGVPLWRQKKIHPELQKRLGLVFQYPDKQLFAHTVAEEFAYSLRSFHLPKATVAQHSQQALNEVGLSEKILSASPHTLSGGQKRRVALATTLATHPDWLLLDEPSAGLDPKGLQQLLHSLTRWKSQLAGGLVIATHDLESFLPLADYVVVLANGRVVHSGPGPELCRKPDLLTTTGIGLPTPLVLHQALTKAGFILPNGCLEPVALATSLTQQSLRQLCPDIPATSPNTNVSTHRATPIAPHVDRSEKLAETNRTLSAGFSRFDPRALWVLVTLLSIGMLLQSSWLGLAVSALFCLIFQGISHLPWRRWWAMVRPFAVLTLLTGVLAGLRFAPAARGGFHLGKLWFSTAATGVTLLSMSRVLEVLSLGVVFSTSQAPASLQRALRQTLTRIFPKQRWPDAVSLGTGLVLRFIPVLLSELERFSMIARARGKSGAKPGHIPLKDARSVLIPMLLSVLQLGEDLTLAMAARGYREPGQPRTDSVKLQMNRQDYLLLSVSLGIFILLAGLRWLTS
ncbi:ATP-binding cassette domain-containing protein [Alicyclobacillaceae bacterium I2511]|nr:ATP-binding cassette domain-containing protein [Alicyclobacillaceae bacterium I2511]